MNSTELKLSLNSQLPHLDSEGQKVVCQAFRALRNFLSVHVTSGKGIGGVVFRALFPQTAKGLQAVVQLLDEYLVENCG